MDLEDEELRKYLLELYWKQNLSIRRISKKIDVPRATLWVMFEQLGIRTRTKKKAKKLWWKNELSQKV